MRKAHVAGVLAVILLCVFAVAGSTNMVLAAEKMTKHVAEKSLYLRLGGYDAVAAVVDDFIRRLVHDPVLTRFFTGHSDDSKMRIRQLIVDMVCQATGGPCYYAGRDMKVTHKGLGINEQDWDASVKHFVATLDKFKVHKKEKDELLTIVGGLKSEIVDKPVMKTY
jgi:hemoglobin